MVDHAEGIRDILMAYSGYMGGYSPSHRGINEIDSTKKFHVSLGEEIITKTHWTTEEYTITLEASSEADLQTLKNALLNSATDRPSGFIPSTSYEFKLYQQEASHAYYVASNSTSSDNFPISEGETTDTYHVPTPSKTTGNDMDATYMSATAVYVMILNLPTFINYATAKLGLYITSTSATKDSTIHTLNTSEGYYEHSSPAFTYVTFTVGGETTAITSATANQYNEYTITDLVTEVLGYHAKDPFIKLAVGSATDQGDNHGITASRKDTDGSVPSTEYPYIEYTVDTTASGYPYWIGFDRSKKLQSGPNVYRMEMKLYASYEVTS